MLLAGACSADELSAANAAFANKDYAGALQRYTRLANAGNVEAQQHLGEMYWYGEAGTVDEAKAEAWFRKAAAKGNTVASASLDLMRQRAEPTSITGSTNTTARTCKAASTAARRRVSLPSRSRTTRSTG
jgi:TPR repeat protein